MPPLQLDPAAPPVRGASDIGFERLAVPVGAFWRSDVMIRRALHTWHAIYWTRRRLHAMATLILRVDVRLSRWQASAAKRHVDYKRGRFLSGLDDAS